MGVLLSHRGGSKGCFYYYFCAQKATLYHSHDT